MNTARIGHRRTAVMCGLALFMACMMLLAGSPSDARAGQSNYCGNQTLGVLACYGEPRTMYAEYGWGEHHSVCVYATDQWKSGGVSGNGPACSGGPGLGVYNSVGFTGYLSPVIYNTGGSANRVHGVAYQP